jgi:phytoene dehydrogenase-like protein
MTDRYDIAVVGGGIAGLVAAGTAATGGAAVVLVDGRQVGGRARTTEHRGFRFNQGAHAIYNRGALMAAAQRLGVHVTGGAPLLSDAQASRDGHGYPLPAGAVGLLKSRLLGARGKLAAKRVFDAYEKVDPASIAGVSEAQWLADLKVPDDLRAFLQMFSRLTSYANAPEQMSAEVTVRQYRLGMRGVTYADGGWQRLVDGFTAVARGAGAKILDHRVATGVRRDRDGWLVETAAGTIAASSVVLAAGPPAASAALVDVEQQWVEQAGPPSRASCLDLGVSKSATPPVLLGIDEPLYLSTHTPPADLAPDGFGVVEVMRYLRPDDEFDHAQSEAMLWAHAAAAGIARDDVVAHRYLHAMTVSGGIPVARRAGFAGRPPVADAELRPGLFLAGDWVGAEGMLGDAAAASGIEAGTQALAWRRAKIPA